MGVPLVAGQRAFGPHRWLFASKLDTVLWRKNSLLTEPVLSPMLLATLLLGSWELSQCCLGSCSVSNHLNDIRQVMLAILLIVTIVKYISLLLVCLRPFSKLV